jgi:hypothetical protein
MKTFKIPIDASFGTSFAIVNLPGKTYVCPGWHQVPQGTTREQIKFVEGVNIFKAKSSLKVSKKPKKSEWKVKSSNGKKIYTITNQPYWNCTCPANQFRRGDCKHIKKIKGEI